MASSTAPKSAIARRSARSGVPGLLIRISAVGDAGRLRITKHGPASAGPVFRNRNVVVPGKLVRARPILEDVLRLHAGQEVRQRAARGQPRFKADDALQEVFANEARAGVQLNAAAGRNCGDLSHGERMDVSIVGHNRIRPVGAVSERGPADRDLPDDGSAFDQNERLVGALLIPRDVRHRQRVDLRPAARSESGPCRRAVVGPFSGFAALAQWILSSEIASNQPVPSRRQKNFVKPTQ